METERKNEYLDFDIFKKLRKKIIIMNLNIWMNKEKEKEKHIFKIAVQRRIGKEKNMINIEEN